MEIAGKEARRLAIKGGQAMIKRAAGKNNVLSS